jgi:beta-aspartyl-peptidase (threonine type)
MRLTYVILFILLASCSETKIEYALVLHGGAGNISHTTIPDSVTGQYLAVLSTALETGEQILKGGGTSLDAVEQVIIVLEDSPLFNAGKGAVFTNEGRNELDASIMDGGDLKAGAVAAVGDIKNPISLARLVMEKSKHVMLSGAGASRFAREQGMTLVDSSYFHTEKRWKELEELRKKEQAEKYGTVGCVALDSYGNLAAGTSTGGMTNKQYNRIGDTPIIGAGNYANNKTCAVSATGHGEFLIRYTVAHDISALMEYSGKTVEEAADIVINDKLTTGGGTGGVICLDKAGNIAMTFNTTGMFRAFVKSNGEKGIYIFREE